MRVPSGARATISVNVPPRSIQNCQPPPSASCIIIANPRSALLGSRMLRPPLTVVVDYSPDTRNEVCFLAGTIRGVAVVYNRFQYTAERRDALDQWGGFVAALVRPGAYCLK